MEKWAGKVAVVTGASGGIGAGICKELVRAGMIVCGFSRRVDKVEAVRATLFDVPGQLIPVCCSNDEESIVFSLKWVDRTYERVDLLVNSDEDVTSSLLLDDNNTDDLCSVMETNLIGTCICTRETVKLMKKYDIKGNIVNINSIFGHKINMCVPGMRPINGMYPACKYALTALTECVRQELIYKESEIKISSISPGLVDTELLTKATDHEMVKYMPKLQPEDVADALKYILTRPPHVQVHDIIIKPVGEFL